VHIIDAGLPRRFNIAFDNILDTGFVTSIGLSLALYKRTKQRRRNECVVPTSLAGKTTIKRHPTVSNFDELQLTF
jgi:hypothetical protein